MDGQRKDCVEPKSKVYEFDIRRPVGDNQVALLWCDGWIGTSPTVERVVNKSGSMLFLQVKTHPLLVDVTSDAMFR